MFNLNLKCFKNRANDNSGITLVELLISISITLIVVVAAYFVLLYQTGTFRLSRSVSVEQERLNIAFNNVKYSLKIAGFDYGTGYYYNTTYNPIPPVLIIPANSNNNNPYEVLISYNTVPQNPNSCVLMNTHPNALTSGQCDVSYTSNCPISDFHVGEIIGLIATRYCFKANPPVPATLCITGIHGNTIQANSKQGGVCSTDPNVVPNLSVATATGVTKVNQIMYFWGNSNYNAILDNNNNPVPNKPGALYRCTVFQDINSPSSTPECQTGSILQLDDYVTNFSVDPLTNVPVTKLYPYLYRLSISVESNVAVTSSPAFSVNTGYTPSPGGGSPENLMGRSIPGYNVVKTLSASVFLRNIKNGK